MQRVVDSVRTVRERALRSVKVPLASLTVVHPDAAFLADIEGALSCS
jgi:hypothetical protein